MVPEMLSFKVREKCKKNRNNRSKKFRTFGNLLGKEPDAAFFHGLCARFLRYTTGIVNHHIGEGSGNALRLHPFIFAQIPEMLTGAKAFTPVEDNLAETILKHGLGRFFLRGVLFSGCFIQDPGTDHAVD